MITDAEDKTITYVSNKPEIASVNEDGLVTANKKGKAVITVTGGGYTEKVTVNCKKVLYANSRIPQYELADKYLKDIEKARIHLDSILDSRTWFRQRQAD